MWETVSLICNYCEFTEIAEFNESPAPFRKNSIITFTVPSYLIKEFSWMWDTSNEVPSRNFIQTNLDMPCHKTCKCKTLCSKKGADSIIYKGIWSKVNIVLPIRRIFHQVRWIRQTRLSQWIAIWGNFYVLQLTIIAKRTSANLWILNMYCIEKKSCHQL